MASCHRRAIRQNTVAKLFLSKVKVTGNTQQTLKASVKHLKTNPSHSANPLNHIETIMEFLMFQKCRNVFCWSEIIFSEQLVFNYFNTKYIQSEKEKEVANLSWNFTL